MNQNLDWKKDTLGDYNITVRHDDKSPPCTYGKIVQCCPTSGEKERWMLLVMNSFYGFYKSYKSAKRKFANDCVPKGECPDCGLPNGSAQCCQNDEDLWK